LVGRKWSSGFAAWSGALRGIKAAKSETSVQQVKSRQQWLSQPLAGFAVTNQSGRLDGVRTFQCRCVCMASPDPTVACSSVVRQMRSRVSARRALAAVLVPVMRRGEVRCRAADFIYSLPSTSISSSDGSAQRKPTKRQRISGSSGAAFACTSSSNAGANSAWQARSYRSLM
jgi:hypothetical protein